MKVSQRTYIASEVITFSNTKGKFGGLSNMAPDYTLFVNEIIIPNVEALYQACRFPLFPELQKKIISQSSPMDAKRISRENTLYTRQDWENVKFEIMRWCVMVKLVQNFESFGSLLLSTNNKPIVEYSTKDQFWGAAPSDDKTLKGVNALGRLLMDIREKYVVDGSKINSVQPPNIPGFLLFDNVVTTVHDPSYIIMDFEDKYAMELA